MRYIPGIFVAVLAVALISATKPATTQSAPIDQATVNAVLERLKAKQEDRQTRSGVSASNSRVEEDRYSEFRIEQRRRRYVEWISKNLHDAEFMPLRLPEERQARESERRRWTAAKAAMETISGADLRPLLVKLDQKKEESRREWIVKNGDVKRIVTELAAALETANIVDWARPDLNAVVGEGSPTIIVPCDFQFQTKAGLVRRNRGSILFSHNMDGSVSPVEIDIDGTGQSLAALGSRLWQAVTTWELSFEGGTIALKSSTSTSAPAAFP